MVNQNREFTMSIRTLGLATLLALALPAVAHDYKAGELSIDHPWSRELPVDLPGAAAYFTLHNHGSQPDRLLSVSTPRAHKADLHFQAAGSSPADMKHMGAVEIPAHGEVTFSPGANHVMLSGVEPPLKAGEHFPMTLQFEKAGKVEVEVEVKNADALTAH